MSLFPSIAIYFVLWWLCLFIVLPFGARSRHEAGDAIEPGTDPGAPSRTLLLRKVIATTILAAIIFACVYIYFGVYGMTLEDLMF